MIRRIPPSPAGAANIEKPRTVGIVTFLQKTLIRARPSAGGDRIFSLTSPAACRGVCPTDADTMEQAEMHSQQTTDATKKIPGEGFKRPWPPLIKMDAAVKAKVEKLFNP